MHHARPARPLAHALLLAALAWVSPAGAVPHDAGAPSVRSPRCADIAQNQLTVQFAPALGITADAAGNLVASNTALLDAAQTAELRRLQSVPGVSWRAELDVATLTTLRARSGADPVVAESLAQLAAFLRATVGGTPHRSASLHTGTSFDALPVMSAAECASTASLLATLRAMRIVSSATVSEVPGPPP